MDNKLSELSKPVFEIEVSGGHWLNCTSGKLTPDASADFSEWPDGVNRLYSQEYVSALDKVAQFWIGESAGWKKRAEDAEKRIAELEQVPTIKHMRSVEEALIRATDMVSELEAKLATPVRLPGFYKDADGNVWLNPVQVAKEIRRSGFTVEDK
jgi:hypothetical protein